MRRGRDNVHMIRTSSSDTCVRLPLFEDVNGRDGESKPSILTVGLDCPTVVRCSRRGERCRACDIGETGGKEVLDGFPKSLYPHPVCLGGFGMRADGLRIVVRTLWKLFYRQQIKYTRGTRPMFVCRAVVCATAATGGGNGIRYNRDDIVF